MNWRPAPASRASASPTLALYAIAAGSEYGANFHDVVSGCNPDKTGTSYCSGTGYDLVRGLGSPKNTLIYTLAGVDAYQSSAAVGRSRPSKRICAPGI
jgi:hypothetical protein